MKRKTSRHKRGRFARPLICAIACAVGIAAAAGVIGEDPVSAASAPIALETGSYTAPADDSPQGLVALFRTIAESAPIRLLSTAARGMLLIFR